MNTNEDRWPREIRGYNALFKRDIRVRVAQHAHRDVPRLKLLSQLSCKRECDLFLRKIRRDSRSSVASPVSRIDHNHEGRSRRTSYWGRKRSWKHSLTRTERLHPRFSRGLCLWGRWR